MTDVIPIRTLHGNEAKWALEAQCGDLVPLALDSPHRGCDAHVVIERSITMQRNDWWVVIKCSCGQTFSGALRCDRARPKP